MSTYLNSELLAAASQNVYLPQGASSSALIASGFIFDQHFVSEETGFVATVWVNSSTGELVVAYRGTDPSAQDFYTDLQYGKPQYQSPEFDALLIEIGKKLDDGSISSINFTGHSLGGALAQYAVHDFLAENLNDPNLPAVTLTTFNALGGMAAGVGDSKFIPDFNESLFASIDATHYRISNDPVSLLGEGHIGGVVKSIEIPGIEVMASHGIANFTGTNQDGTNNSETPPINFSLAVEQTDVPYIFIGNAITAAQTASAITVSATSSAAVFTDLEAAGRLLVGILQQKIGQAFNKKIVMH